MTDFRTWDAWHGVHQPFELDWWTKNLPTHSTSNDAEFEAQWAPVREFVRPEGKVIDVGSGPRPPFLPGVVIEPLALEYMKIVPGEWWERAVVHAQPAERFIPDLRADTVICWNCIDHAVGWREILDNLAAYAGAEGRVAIATDFHEPFVGHPGFARDEFMREIDNRFVEIDRREPFGRDLALLLRGR